MCEVRGQTVFWVHISQKGPWLPGVASPRGVTPGLGERKQLDTDPLLLETKAVWKDCCWATLEGTGS